MANLLSRLITACTQDKEIVANYVACWKLANGRPVNREDGLPRYFFNLESQGDVIRDDVGVEINDLEQAVQGALDALQEMRESGELAIADVQWDLVVRDENQNAVRRFTV